MKVAPRLVRLHSFKNIVARGRFTGLVLMVAVLAVTGATVSGYITNRQQYKAPIAEQLDTKPSVPETKAETKQPHAVEEQPAAPLNTQTTPSSRPQPTPAQTVKPAPDQTSKPRPGTSEDPAFVACLQKLNELYVKYIEDNVSKNAEKSLALAVVDELYNTGFYDEYYPGDTEPYNQWQIDRAEVEAEYNNQLMALSNAHEVESAPYSNC